MRVPAFARRMIRQLSLRAGTFLPIIEANGGAAMTKLFAPVDVADALFLASCTSAPPIKADVDGAQVCHDGSGRAGRARRQSHGQVSELPAGNAQGYLIGNQVPVRPH